MKVIFIILFLLNILGCSKPKTVLICGNHVCVNKMEAEQYFEENLSIEVKIINKKRKKNIDLIKLNLINNSNDKREVILEKKINTNNEIKVLSSNEIKKIKSDVRKRLNNKDIAKRSIAKKIETKNLNLKNNKKKEDFKKNNLTNKVIKDKNNVADVCAIIEECSIEEISKYLIKLGKNKGFPNITSRE